MCGWRVLLVLVCYAQAAVQLLGVKLSKRGRWSCRRRGMRQLQDTPSTGPRTRGVLTCMRGPVIYPVGPGWAQAGSIYR